MAVIDEIWHRVELLYGKEVINACSAIEYA